MALLYSSVPVSHGSASVSQDAQIQDPETEAAEWNTANTDLFPPVLFPLWHDRISIV